MTLTTLPNPNVVTDALTRAPRPYLPRIDYAADGLDAIRARLRARLPQVLPGWNAALTESTDGTGDSGLALLDALAAMLATLNAYADQRANESYLRTAALTSSLTDLAALIDYRLGQGASAAALQAFYAKPEQSGTVASGFKVAAGQLTFETLESLAINAAHNALRVVGYNQSGAVLQLAANTTDTQDVQVTLDARYSGLKAGVPIVFDTDSTGSALHTVLPAAIADLDDPAATQLTWAAGAAAVNATLPIATLTLRGRPQHNAKLAAAARADEITLGQNQLPVAQAQMFTEGGAVLIDCAGLQFGATVLAKQVDAAISPAGTLTLNRGVPSSLRRSSTRVLEGTSCGYSTSTVRAGSTELLRESFSSKKKKDYPHTPDPGDLLLMVDASGVEIATVASASGNQIVLTQPITRALRPVAHAFDPLPSVRFYCLKPNDAATHQTTLRPLLLGEVSNVYASGNTTLVLEKTVDAITVESTVAVSDGVLTSSHRVLEASVVDGRTQLVLEGTVSTQMRVAWLTVYGAFMHAMHVHGYDHSEATVAAGTSQLELVGALTELQSGQRLVLADGTQAEGARIAQVQVLSDAVLGDSTQIALAQPLEHSYALGDLWVYGNVAQVSHGASATDEVLGSGDPTLAPQSFTLRRSPLAWVPDSTSARGVSPALQIFVDGQLWQAVDTLSASGPLDRHYTLSTDESGRVAIRFGAGRYGQAPASGSNNIVARYRVGRGSDGNVQASAIKTMPQALAFIERTFNPLDASGGADPETAASARTQAALQVRTLARAVSLTDYADLARSYAGIAQARADMERESNVPYSRKQIVITCAAEGGNALSTPQKEALLSFLRARAAQPDLIVIRDHRDWPIRLALTVQVQSDMQQATVHSALLAALGAEDAEGTDSGLFSFAQQSLGEPLALSTVYAVAQGVAGVEHVLATAFHPEAQTAAVLDRISVPTDAIATGGHASDASVGRLSLQLIGGVV